MMHVRISAPMRDAAFHLLDTIELIYYVVGDIIRSVASLEISRKIQHEFQRK